MQDSDGMDTNTRFFSGGRDKQPVPWPTPECDNQLEREGERPKQPG